MENQGQIEAVLKTPARENVTQLRSFLVLSIIITDSFQTWQVN